MFFNRQAILLFLLTMILFSTVFLRLLLESLRSTPIGHE